MKFTRDKRADEYHLPIGKKTVYEGEGEYTPLYTIENLGGGYINIHTDNTILVLTLRSPGTI